MNKKFTYIMFGVVSLLIGGMIWVYLSDFETKSIESFILGVMILALGLMFYFKRHSTKDLVHEDELSKLMLREASSRSFYMSLYIWVALMYLSDRFSNLETVFGLGIACMGMLFICNIVYLKIKGIQ